MRWKGLGSLMATWTNAGPVPRAVVWSVTATTVEPCPRGQVIVATEIGRPGHDPLGCPAAPLLAGARRVILAAPRSFCAGVERAIEIVRQLLARRGAPVYVRKQIVHNTHVVADLQRHGAVYVDELDEVPAGATVVFSAHGVSYARHERCRMAHRSRR
jgi:4-hydroxy-3-methylbut-2-enyl diphosphate reductase